jgi:hypothetical protein
MTVKLIYERIQNNNDEKREAGRQKLEDKINEFIKNIDNSSISISQTFVDDGLILSTDVSCDNIQKIIKVWMCII